MSSVDQFESVFKAASKELFNFLEIDIKKALLVSDCDETGRAALEKSVRQFLSAIEKNRKVEWLMLNGQDFKSVQDLLNGIENHRPDLIVTYRHLHSDAWQWPYSLGEHLDVMTQVTDIPVAVIPHPEKEEGILERLKSTDNVLAITDRMTGDHRLASYGIYFTRENGTLFLAHLEDEDIYDRYMDVISKIPQIDTDVAREKIKERLIKEPADYIKSFQQFMSKKDSSIKVESLVAMGKQLHNYKTWIDEHEIDLVIMNTKDEDQLAMHGLAHPLVVELRDTPLLLL